MIELTGYNNGDKFLSCALFLEEHIYIRNTLLFKMESSITYIALMIAYFPRHWVIGFMNSATCDLHLKALE